MEILRFSSAAVEGGGTSSVPLGRVEYTRNGAGCKHRQHVVKAHGVKWRGVFGVEQNGTLALYFHK